MSLKQKVRQLERKQKGKGKFLDLKKLFGEDIDLGGRQFRTYAELIQFLHTFEKQSRFEETDSNQSHEKSE